MPRVQLRLPPARGAGKQYVCPRPQCGHRWHVSTQAEALVHRYDRRVAVPDIRVVAGATPQTVELSEGTSFISRPRNRRNRPGRRGA